MYPPGLIYMTSLLHALRRKLREQTNRRALINARDARSSSKLVLSRTNALRAVGHGPGQMLECRMANG